MGNPRYRTACLTAFLVTTACSDDDEDKRQFDGPAPLFEGRTPDETLKVPGISARVEVARDDLGIPHIYGETLEDVSFAQGYIHARDRFFQIDLFRHLVQGKLSEYFGELTFGTDVRNRSNMMTTEGRPVFEVMAEQLEGQEKAVLEAYSAGVNLYIRDLKAGKVPVPFGYDVSLLVRFSVDLVPEWTPADTLAIGRLQEQNLSDSTAADIARGTAKQNLPAELFADLVRYAPPEPIAILPDFYDSGFGPAAGCTSVAGCDAAPGSRVPLRELYRGLDLASVTRSMALADPFGMDRMPEGVEGSNNWVIDGEHTATGNALVANDPHLRFYLPSLFHNGHMDTRHYGKDEALASSVVGVSFPGIPGVLIGHNEHVAWGATTVGWDVSDVYVETLNAAGDAVLFNGEYVPIVRISVPIRVNGDTGLEERPQVFEIVPHHGVVVPDSKVDGKALTRKWTGHEPRSGVGALLARTTARNIDDFMEAMSRFVAGAQNWNGADTAGNTGYIPGARVPVRASVSGACDPSVPMDGTGPCEWTGIIPASEMPRVKNRSNGFVVTANNDVTGTLADNDPTNDPQYLHSSNADGFRARRITDRVEDLVQAGAVTRDDMVALQGDTVSLEAERLLPFLRTARTEEPELVESLGLGDALDRLEAWDFTNPSGVAEDFRTDGGPDAAEVEASIAAAIFNTFRPRFFAAAFADEKATYGVSFADGPAALHLLEASTPARAAVFDDPATTEVESPSVVILRALSAALAFLKTKLGDSPDSWRWGELHQVEVQDLFGEFGLTFRQLGPYARGGASSTVDVAGTGGATDDFRFFAGPQMRFVAEVGAEGIVSACSLPGGQIDDDQSPHYDDLMPLWLNNDTFPYRFTVEDVVEHTEWLLVLEPEG